MLVGKEKNLKISRGRRTLYTIIIVLCLLNRLQADILEVVDMLALKCFNRDF